MTVIQSLHEIQEEVNAACERASRKKEDITIIGVTKYVTIERTE